MEVVNLQLQPDWEQWRREMEDKWTWTWRERVRRWMSEGEDDEETDNEVSEQDEDAGGETESEEIQVLHEEDKKMITFSSQDELEQGSSAAEDDLEGSRSWEDEKLVNLSSQDELEQGSSAAEDSQEGSRSSKDESKCLQIEGRNDDDRKWRYGIHNAMKEARNVWEDEGSALWTSHEEEEEEEESSDDDDEETVSSQDEDGVKVYSKDDHHVEMFHTLTAFRDSSQLTDLTLSTKDGGRLHLHSIVMAAVSSLVKDCLNKNMHQEGEHRRSISLDLDVDHHGLEAIVEFAYTGLISCLEDVQQVKAAAQTIGAHRVLDLLRKMEESSTNGSGISSSEQLAISLQSTRELWMDRVGCDIILEVVGLSLPVHRVILAASSDFFRGMFSSGMRESTQSHISLPFLSASDLEVLTGSSYSGTLPLSWSRVFEISSTSLQLQYQPALSLCLNFLQQELNPHSCLDVASFAEAYQVSKLVEVSDNFVLRQFQKVSCTSKFKDLPAKQLLRYLNSRSLCVPSELVVFKAVAAWIQARPKTRLKLARELMKTIHFPLMSFEEFKEVRSVNMWSEHNLADLYETVWEDFCSSEVEPQSQCRVYLPEQSLVLTGGDQISEDLGRRHISREVWFGNSLLNHTGIKKAMEWRQLGEMPEPSRFRHEVAVLKGQLYVFGGKKYYGTGDTLHCVYRYNPLENSWHRMADMTQKRNSFSAVVIDGSIYAIGGHCDPEYIESVECFSPAANSWSLTCPLDLTLGGHVAKVLQGQIFISGGLNSDYPCLASLFVYHPERGSTYLASMSQPRAHHCMEALDDRLYVAGGITLDSNNTVIDQLICEVYIPASDMWTAFSSLPVPHVGAGSAILEGKLYLLGGYSQEDYSDTKMVHRYDPALRRWENMGKMPGPNNDLRVSLLRLPPRVRM
ncbi:kelch-like protein 33 [Dunckerocampus dactyliophorus]|uniref:kelch-like protein 33 n=1 Tax=Dunckerocampus dactyliophorus TaxID=161453 RepID=UPI002407560B|nr:kelch-like protein 33 [Dunckerocampus dactyliophorus]